MFYIIFLSLFTIGTVFLVEDDSLSLEDYIKSKGYQITEGHSHQKNTGQVEFFKTLLKDNSYIRLIGEVGFNAGHSSEAFLKANEDFKVISFDIVDHDYTLIGKEYIDFKYPNRHRLIPGNSLKSIPNFSKRNPDIVFDLIFIDGGHQYHIAKRDIFNFKPLATKNTIVLIDDYNHPEVKKAIRTSIDEKIILKGKVVCEKGRKMYQCKYLF